MMPFISVIVTAYQYRPYIVEALESIAHQDLDNNKYEVIIVANYDKSQISRYLRDDWKFIYSGNRWIGPKVLEALKESSGDIIVFLEDDDLFDKNKLKVIYEIFKENPNLGFYRHKVRIINENGKEAKLPNSIYDGQKILIDKDQQDIRNAYLTIYKNRGGYASVSSMAMRREILEKYSTYLNQIFLSIDSFYLVVSFLSDYDMLFDNLILGKYRLQKKSASSAITDFNEFVKYYAYKYAYICKDAQVIYDITKGSEIEEFELYGYLLSKALYKLFKSNKNEERCLDKNCKLKFYEVLKMLNNPYNEDTFKNFIIAIASYFPFKLRKVIIKKIYNFRLNMYNNLFNY